MKRYPQVLSYLFGSIWAIQPDKLTAILGAVQARLTGLSIDAAAVAAANRQDRETGMRQDVAVLPIVGTISQRADILMEASGGASTERIGREFDRLVSDTNVGAIILDVDSPGGTVAGTPELADKVLAARGSKPIVAVANSLAASAAYWIASAADELVVTPSGDVGSIGVLAVHTDASKFNESEGFAYDFVVADISPYKAEYADTGPMSDEARRELQRQVDSAGDMFLRAVARNRGVTPKDVRANYGQGRTYPARESVERGMADRVETLEQAIARMQGRLAAKRSRGTRAAIERERLRLERLR